MTCNNECVNCDCKEEKMLWSDHIYTDSEIEYTTVKLNITDTVPYSIQNFSVYQQNKTISYKYSEDKILADLKAYLDNTYSEHYMTQDKGIECFDVWIALGDSVPTFRNTAIKYLWRYGKKNGNNKADLMKALHYIMLCLHVDHYKDDK